MNYSRKRKAKNDYNDTYDSKPQRRTKRSKAPERDLFDDDEDSCRSTIIPVFINNSNKDISSFDDDTSHVA